MVGDQVLKESNFPLTIPSFTTGMVENHTPLYFNASFIYRSTKGVEKKYNKSCEVCVVSQKQEIPKKYSYGISNPTAIRPNTLLGDVENASKCKKRRVVYCDSNGESKMSSEKRKGKDCPEFQEPLPIRHTSRQNVSSKQNMTVFHLSPSTVSRKTLELRRKIKCRLDSWIAIKNLRKQRYVHKKRQNPNNRGYNYNKNLKKLSNSHNIQKTNKYKENPKQSRIQDNNQYRSEQTMARKYCYTKNVSPHTQIVTVKIEPKESTEFPDNNTMEGSKSSAVNTMILDYYYSFLKHNNKSIFVAPIRRKHNETTNDKPPQIRECVSVIGGDCSSNVRYLDVKVKEEELFKVNKEQEKEAENESRKRKTSHTSNETPPSKNMKA